MAISPLRLVLMGTGNFALPTFRALLQSPHVVVGLVTQPQRSLGAVRSSTRQASAPVALLAQEHGLPLLQPEDVNSPQGVASLRQLSPDLLVVAAYGQILSPEVLSVAPQGGINVHASLLPRYRGAAPVAWAIYHGETQTGVTIIRLSPRLDAGDILAQEVVAIGPEETAGELEARLAAVGARLALQVVDAIAAGAARGVPQDHRLASKAPKLRKEHGLLDWRRRAPELVNQIRAMQPWPMAYTFWHRAGRPPQRLLLYRARAEAFPAELPALPPGTPLRPPLAQGRLCVAAGEGLVEVLELQPAGKRRMTAAEFLRGHPLQPGDFFGPENP